MGARFELNCYNNWAQIILRQPREPPFTLLIQEGVTHGYPLLMVLYDISLVPLAEEIWADDPGLNQLFCADEAVFDGLEWRSA